MSGLPGRILRFALSGGTAALTTLFVLYLLHGLLSAPYLAASAIGFLAGVSINFLLQRRVVFLRTGRAGVRREAATFLVVNLIALVLNTALLYIFVEFLHLYYLAAQVLVQVIIAAGSFLVYGFIFRAPENPQRSV